MAAAATLGSAPAAGAATPTDKIPIKLNLWIHGSGKEMPLEMASNETLGGLIAKVIQATGTEYHVEITWDGRDRSTLPLSTTLPRKTSNFRENQYFITWTDCQGPEIHLHTGTPTIAQVKTPLRVRELTGCPPLATVRGAFKSTQELFDRIKVADVCALNHHNVFGVRVFDEAFAGRMPKRAPTTAQSSLSSARPAEGERKT